MVIFVFSVFSKDFAGSGQKILACLGLFLIKTEEVKERKERLEGEIWEGDERRKLQFSESGGSLNCPDLFTEVPFL